MSIFFSEVSFDVFLRAASVLARRMLALTDVATFAFPGDPTAEALEEHVG